MELSGLWLGPRGDEVTDLPERLGPEYILTWVNIGPPGVPEEGRTIRQYLYPDAPEGMIIHTPSQPGLDGWGRSVIGWFRADSELRHAMVDLGVPFDSFEQSKPDTPLLMWVLRLLASLIF